jgi:hypothetical protein
MVKHARYEIVKALGKVELRKYGSIVLARVDGYGDGGFGLLFRFISGENRQRRKVEMTAPVIGEGGDDINAEAYERIAMTAPVIGDGGSLAFVMPDGYSLESTPEPLDDRVRIEEMPMRTLAVWRFSGFFTEKAFSTRSHQLLEVLNEAGISTRGTVFSMRYNSPFALPFLRRNEVAIEVDLD